MNVPARMSSILMDIERENLSESLFNNWTKSPRFLRADSQRGAMRLVDYRS